MTAFNNAFFGYIGVATAFDYSLTHTSLRDLRKLEALCRLRSEELKRWKHTADAPTFMEFIGFELHARKPDKD